MLVRLSAYPPWRGVEGEQASDTSVFLRYAATFDQLLPVTGDPYAVNMIDSASLQTFNQYPQNVSVKKFVSLFVETEKSVSEQEQWSEHMEWDAEGRVVRRALYLPKDTISYSDTRIKYLTGSKIAYVTRRDEHEASSPDTLFYTYNRSGWISSWRKHEFNGTAETNVTGSRMYDSQGRLIVATYMIYGPLLGTYTYEYNSKNQLVRRCFTTESGAILCTDTIEYTGQTQSNSIQLVTHKLKVAGSNDWVTLEKKTVNSHTGKILTYSDYNDTDTNYFYQNLPSYTLQFEYDENGRVISETFGNEITPSMITAKYSYGKYDQPDAIEYSELVREKKTTTTRVYSRDVRQYDEQGRIVSREITNWLFDEMRKKSTLVPREIVKIRYAWR